MLNFEFYSPTRFIFGKNQEQQVGEQLKKRNVKKVLLHYGGSSIKKSGLYDRVVKSLNEAKIEFVELGGVVPNPRDTLVYKGIEMCKQNNVDFVLAVGGGSVIDSSKAIAVGTPYEGDFWDFYCGKLEATEVLPVGVILTIPAAGSEGSDGSVITKEDGMLKRSYGTDLMRPVFAIMNPELTYTLPNYQTACGAADIMAHVFERYFTNTAGVDFSDRLCESVLSTIVKYVPIALKENDNYEARANIMWAGTIAHNGLCGVDRENDWGSHQIEHELSGLYDVAHGAGLAVVFPAWMRYVYKHDIMRFAQIAQRVWGCEMDFRNPEATALKGIEALEQFFKSIGLPITFNELGAKESDIDFLAENADYNNGDKMGYFNPLSVDDVKQVLRIAAR